MGIRTRQSGDQRSGVDPTQPLARPPKRRQRAKARHNQAWWAGDPALRDRPDRIPADAAHVEYFGSMKTDIIKTAKVSAILFIGMALFIAGCAVIGLWAFIIPLAVVIVALVYGMISEERWEREEKLAKR